MNLREVKMTKTELMVKNASSFFEEYMQLVEKYQLMLSSASIIKTLYIKPKDESEFDEIVKELKKDLKYYEE